MIKSYTLDCGCYFEHRKREGHDASFELTSSCSLHDALSSEPPVHTLPPVPFLAVPQAGSPTRELPMVQTNSKYEAVVENAVEKAMEHLEHTQPIFDVDVLNPWRLRQALGAMDTRLQTLERKARGDER
jgi:hypothetical protein